MLGRGSWNNCGQPAAVGTHGGRCNHPSTPNHRWWGLRCATRPPARRPTTPLPLPAPRPPHLSLACCTSPTVPRPPHLEHCPRLPASFGVAGEGGLQRGAATGVGPLQLQPLQAAPQRHAHGPRRSDDVVVAAFVTGAAAGARAADGAPAALEAPLGNVAHGLQRRIHQRHERLLAHVAALRPRARRRTWAQAGTRGTQCAARAQLAGWESTGERGHGAHTAKPELSWPAGRLEAERRASSAAVRCGMVDALLRLLRERESGGELQCATHTRPVKRLTPTCSMTPRMAVAATCGFRRPCSCCCCRYCIICRGRGLRRGVESGVGCG